MVYDTLPITPKPSSSEVKRPNSNAPLTSMPLDPPPCPLAGMVTVPIGLMITPGGMFVAVDGGGKAAEVERRHPRVDVIVEHM